MVVRPGRAGPGVYAMDHFPPNVPVPESAMVTSDDGTNHVIPTLYKSHYSQAASSVFSSNATQPVILQHHLSQ